MKDASRKPKAGRNFRGMREARLIPNMNLLKDNSQWSVSSDSIVWSLFNDLVSLYWLDSVACGRESVGLRSF